MTDHEPKPLNGDALADIICEAGLIVDALQVIEDQTGEVKRRIVELVLRLRDGAAQHWRRNEP